MWRVSNKKMWHQCWYWTSQKRLNFSFSFFFLFANLQICKKRKRKNSSVIHLWLFVEISYMIRCICRQVKFNICYCCHTDSSPWRRFITPNAFIRWHTLKNQIVSDKRVKETKERKPREKSKPGFFWKKIWNNKK